MHHDISLGAHKSPIDPRTITHDSITRGGVPLVKGGYTYATTEIEHQHTVGICTAISIIQNRQKVHGRKYSPEFQYLLQKKYYDPNWIEGSSLFSALKVGKKYGFLPIELFKDLNGVPYATEADRFLPYPQYIAKLEAISEAEIQRLITLCVDKIFGYASVNVGDAQAIALAINQSEAGILCRIEVGSEWYTPSWFPQDINPIRPPTPATDQGGHAIIDASFDYSMVEKNTLANTWGTTWNMQGCGDILLDKYSPTEGWIITISPVVYPLTTDLRFGMVSSDVTNMQNILKIHGYFDYNSTGFFGPLTLFAVRAFQKAYGLPTTGFCGPLTRAKLNALV